MEELLNDSPDFNVLENYLTSEELVVTGIMLPHNFDISNNSIDIEPENSEFLFNFVDEISFYSSRNSIMTDSDYNYPPIASMNEMNHRINIPMHEIENLKLKILLKNGKN